MKSNIAIIGAGEIGSALGKILRQGGQRVALWDRRPGRVKGQRPFSQMVPAADFVFLCVPSWGLGDLLRALRPLLQKKTILVLLSKGLDPKTHQTTAELVPRLVPGAAFALLSGPMLAEELASGRGGAALVATKDLAVGKKVARLFVRSGLRLVWSSDLRGAALAGVLKNIYAMALGIAAGLKWGENRKGALTSQALVEMSAIISHLGGRPATAYGLSGLGDFIATGFSRYSANRQYGEQLVKKGSRCSQLEEGCVALPSLLKLLGPSAKKFPLLCALREVALQHRAAGRVFSKMI
jgi:glycerol-3-phosphate dehydrogenase (NAD(P)+)